MSEIDWSKAPEGATHWMQESCDWLEGFWKRVGAANYFYEKGEWVFSGGKPFGHPKLIARPSPAWSGEGLPPVGTVCEYIGGKHGMPDPWPAEVIHHYHGGACMVAAFLYTRDGQTRVAGAIDSCFRPIRTPEQIAADEREAAIKEMLEDAGRPDTAKTRDQAQLLYDAGWRKVERAQ